jgi:hypothetical protein
LCRHFLGRHTMTANGKYMQSRRLRASNQSNRYSFEAAYKR